jgi:quinol monooxygenase YgiN
MTVVMVAKAFPVPEHRAEVIAAARRRSPGFMMNRALSSARCTSGDRLVIIEKYEYEPAVSEHSNGAALADLLSALEGKLSRDLDVQVLVPHPTGKPPEGHAATAPFDLRRPMSPFSVENRRRPHMKTPKPDA